MKLERKEIIEIIKTIAVVISAIAVLGGGFYAFGKFNGRLDQIDRRVDALEVRTDPLRQLKVGRGDLCLKMIEQLGTVHDAKRRQELQEEWKRSDCEGLPANLKVTAPDAAKREIPPPPRQQPER